MTTNTNPNEKLLRHLVVEVLSHEDADKMDMHTLSEALRRKAKEFDIEISIVSAANHILEFMRQ